MDPMGNESQKFGRFLLGSQIQKIPPNGVEDVGQMV
jgi:hypothetical protein